MKHYFIYILIILSITSCAYVEGVKNTKNAAPIPAGQAQPQPSNTAGHINAISNTATTNAAKSISPAR